MKEKFVPTIGVFAGILSREGGLLLRRRTLPEEKKSLISGGTVEREWELPGGIVEQGEMLLAGNEQGLIEALKREIREELGLTIEVSVPLQTFPVVLSKEISGKINNDIALLIIIHPNQWKGVPTGETMWVAPRALNALAKNPAGNRLLSGWGKRMHRMCLIALSYSPNKEFRLEAQETLRKVYQT